MQPTLSANQTEPDTFQVYAWTLSNDAFELAGPLSRPTPRRRTLNLSAAALPDALANALQSGPGSASQTIHVGPRTVQIIVTGPGSGILIHLTRLRQREARAAAYLNWLEEGINALPEAFVLYDADDRLLIANPQYAELYPTIADILRPGVTFPEIAKTALERGQFRYGDDPDAWLTRRLDFHAKAEGFFEQHLDDGRWIQLSERRTPSGGVTSIRADITLLKEREEALQKAKRRAEHTSESMARFLAMFSHELSNGLNGLAGLAQILALDAESPSRQANTRLMLQSTKRLTTVLSDLLDYLKNEAVGVAIRLGTTAPTDLLDTLKAELEPQARQRDVGLSWVVDDNVPAYVDIDSGRVLQVLANLTGNAIKYTEAGGAITVRVDTRGKRLHFTVRDQGIGISPQDVGRLFEYFSQTSNQKPGSTGIGLAICKQLVTAMGGDIGVSSQPGQGSTFWFDVPLRASPTAAPPRVQSVGVKPGRHLRVGVVDDDPINLRVAYALLERSGYLPIILDDTQDIITIVRQQKLDVLLLDLMMPNESGFDIAARLRSQSDPAFTRLILIALTGNIVSDNLAACKKSGIDAVLQKPLFIEQLQYALNWASGFDRSARHHAPFVFSPLVLSTPDPAPIDDAMAVLTQLQHDIGPVRFAQGVGAARDLIRHATQATADSPDSLRQLSHRVAGSASQLGFAALASQARALEALLVPVPPDEIPQRKVQAGLERLREEAARCLPVLNKALAAATRKTRA